MKDLYIRIRNAEEYKDIVTGAYVSPWLFCFPNKIIPTFEEIKKNYHGNSKPLIHLFYNSLTRAYEMQATTASIEKSYPQIKNVKAINWEDVDYELCCRVFGEKK